MSLQFIFGSAGTGKSHTMYTNMINASLKDSTVNYIVLVPEQFTMEAQKKMVSLHPNKGVMYIDILSFNRLAIRIFDELGYQDINIIDDTAKSLIIRKVLEENKNDLIVYGKKTAMSGFVDKMKSAISQLQQYGIDEKKLDEMVEAVSTRPMLHGKLSDIRTTYKAFTDTINDKYITAEELLENLSRVVCESEMIKNSEIYIDGFTGFTPIQYHLLTELIKYARKVVVAVTIPEDQVRFNTIKEQELFNLSKTTINKLGKIADKLNVPIEKPVIVRESEHSRLAGNETLKYLEQNIFRFRQDAVFSGENDAISIHICPNPKEEAEYVAYTISDMVRKEGMRYKDFAVITAGMEQYYRYVDRAFSKYSIPGFIDYKRNISGNPFVNTIKSAIEVIEKNYTYESVFNMLRFGMTDISDDETDRLENYVIRSGIRGRKKWQNPFEKLYYQMTEEELKAINNTREKIVNLLSGLENVFKNKKSTAEDFTRAVYDFIISGNLHIKLKEYENEFASQERLSEAAEYSQTYSEMIKLLDKIVKLFGDEVISIKEYREILSAGIDSIKVGVIPPTIDKVVVGDMERTRLDDVKVVFFIGINDRIIPKSGTAGDIITDFDKEILSAANFELAPTAREKAFIEKFYLYTALTRPSEKLFLSFSKTGASGETMTKSYLINVILSMFPDTEIIDEQSRNNMLDKIVSDDTAVSQLAYTSEDYINHQSNKAVWETLYGEYKDNPDYKDRIINIVSAALYKGRDEAISREMAEALYGKNNTIGITRLERYAECPYREFLTSGIKLMERKEHQIAAVDMGNLYHNALDKFCHTLDLIGIKWVDLDGSKRSSLVKDCVKKVVEEYDNSAFLSSARSAYLTKRIEQMTDRTAWVLSEHLKAGKFEPAYYEMSVSSGRIDRVDLYETDDAVYVKVIDYKSGKKEFSLNDTYYGLQLQLTAYMQDVLKGEQIKHPDKDIVPAGIFYYNIKDPYINKADLKNNGEFDAEYLHNISEEDIRDTQFEQFKMSGMINVSDGIPYMFDEKFEDEEASEIIPVKKSKTGFKSTYPLVSTEQFNDLIKYTEKKRGEMMGEIMDGHIEISPVMQQKPPCEYCKFKSVCGFDVKTGSKYKKLEKLSDKEIWQEINDGSELD